MAKPSRRIRNLLDRPDANDAPDKHAAATSTPILAAAPHQVRGRPTDKHMRSIRAVVGDARRVRVAAGVAAVFAFIATFVWAIVRESAPLGFIGGAVQALLVLGWALAALTFLGTGMLVAIRWGRSVTRSVPSRRRAGQFLARWAMDAHNLLGKGAAMTGRISQRAEIWPPLLCGPVAAASVLGWLDRRIFVLIFEASLFLAIAIWCVRGIVGGVRTVNRDIRVGTALTFVLVWVMESVVLGLFLPHPIDGGAFYTAAQVDAVVLIPVVLYRRVPPAWNGDCRSRQTWEMVTISMILLAIGLAISAGVIAGHNPTPEWFTTDLLRVRGLTLELSSLILGAALFPVCIGIMSLVHRPERPVASDDGGQARAGTTESDDAVDEEA